MGGFSPVSATWNLKLDWFQFKQRLATKPCLLVDVTFSWLVDCKKTHIVGETQLYAVITRVSMEVSKYIYIL